MKSRENDAVHWVLSKPLVFNNNNLVMVLRAWLILRGFTVATMKSVNNVLESIFFKKIKVIKKQRKVSNFNFKYVFV